jgi:hypothetical protein
MRSWIAHSCQAGVLAAPGDPQEAVKKKILSIADPWRQTLTGIRLRADGRSFQRPSLYFNNEEIRERRTIVIVREACFSHILSQSFQQFDQRKGVVLAVFKQGLLKVRPLFRWSS